VPEGHLIHRFALAHQRAFAGAAVEVTSPQGRFGDGARRLDGRRLERVEAYGKHLFYWWEDDEVLHVHLGMQGKFLPVNPDAPPVRQARMRMEVDTASVDLVAPGVCELVGPQGRTMIIRRLGPDPLRDDAHLAAVRSVVAVTRRPIGALLLDQTVVAGIGNVLRAEGLFAAGIHPACRGNALPDTMLGSLWSELVVMMRRGVTEGRIITVRRPGKATDTLPEREGRYVYKQERCLRCGTPVESWALAGRTAYACPHDQPPPSSRPREPGEAE
jgi:endonuclease-8